MFSTQASRPRCLFNSGLCLAELLLPALPPKFFAAASLCSHNLLLPYPQKWAACFEKKKNADCLHEIIKMDLNFWS